MRPITGTALVFCVALLTGCGGGGDGTAPALGSLSSKLFVADSGNSSIASTIDVNPPAGTLTFDRTIVGPKTTISNNVRSLVVDAARKLMYVANGGSILVFDNIGSADGDVIPSRTITSAQFGNITALYLDTVNDMLYAGDLAVGIWMIHDASTAAGLLTPDRRLTGNFGGSSFQIHDIFVDTARDVLYVSRTTSAPTVTNQILVFDDASTVNGIAVTADRVITPSPSMSVGSIFADTVHDLLYMADLSSGTVRVFNDASVTTGTVSASRTINWGSSATDIVVDTARDRLYAINVGNVFIVSDAILANGTVTAKTLSVPGGSAITALAINP